MVKNPLLLGLVAFCVSFGLGLLVNRSFKLALLTGLITLPATFMGVLAASRKQRVQQKWTLTDLQIKIHQLRKWEVELQQALSAMMAAKQRTEIELNYLQAGLDQIQTQAAEQRSYKQQLSQDLMTLNEQKHQVEADLHRWNTQIYSLEQQRGELDLSLRSLKAEKYKVEVSLTSLQDEFQQLQLQLAPQEVLAPVEAPSPLLQAAPLERQQPLESYRQLDRSLAIAVQETPSHVVPQAEAQLQKDKNYVELADEWTEFMKRLPTYELQVLKALVQGNPNAEIKKIAEENITMPELLIDLINDRALNTIGDLIIEPSDGLNTPGISAEYLTNVKQVIQIKGTN